MAERSTRNKIRHHAKESIDKLDGVMQSLKNLDDLAEGRSDYIEQNLPNIIFGLMEFKKLLERFREGL